MSFIKKLVVVVIIMAVVGYAAIMWEAHQNLVSTSEKLARQLGYEVVEGLRDASRSCRDSVDLDSVVVKTDSPLSDSGSASVYISGANDRALALDYTIAVAGEKVYLKPKNHASNQGQIMQFALSGCR
ncbi:TPA: hypothetical protein ACHTCR_004944 [Pseudomonas putida]|uniref:hypothetical protein n=1 Tax=Pseudomonas putida TaxID=303 RepID=UPI000F3BFA70|nr:hypothetical protein [Pseudomonas putida]RNF73223.1 hypothetical protein EFJ98_07765 [Pseudomonas putida]